MTGVRMAKSFPKIKRLDTAATPDRYGIADSPVGFFLAAWQGPLLVRLHLLPAGAEKRVHEFLADWEWPSDLTRDDTRAARLVSTALFPKKSWTGRFPADLQLGFFGTDFQWDVMRQMLKIPSGKTMSYGALANAANAPKAARAAFRRSLPPRPVLGREDRPLWFWHSLEKPAPFLGKIKF
jgi:O6-methylguanine-DNA--protein-cysteine methyltransferase